MFRIACVARLELTGGAGGEAWLAQLRLHCMLCFRHPGQLFAACLGHMAHDLGVRRWVRRGLHCEVHQHVQDGVDQGR